MSHSPNRDDHHCAACAACEHGTETPSGGGPSHGRPPDRQERWPVLASISFFLVPTLLAIVGAALGRGDPTWQLLGAVAGLAAGAGLVIGVARAICQ